MFAHKGSKFCHSVPPMELTRRARIRLSSNLDYTMVARLAITRYYNEIPRLSVTRTPSSLPPTAWFICPDYSVPSGGARKLYHYVDILNAAGLNAAIIHGRSGFRLRWFENKTRVVNARDVTVGTDDILVVPEIYGPRILNLPRNIRQVIINQNVYNTVRELAEGVESTAPYISNPDLALVLVVSQDNLEVIKYLFPKIPVRRLHHSIDSNLFHPPLGSKQRRIAYMPRKRADDSASVISLLKIRGVLDTWETVPLHDLSEMETANILQSAKLFLSFSLREGFGLPPLEALACGCLVVGYHGLAGREYFHPPFATAVEDGDIIGFAQSVENAILYLNKGDDSAAMNAASRFALESYPLETEKRDLTETFASLLERSSARPPR
jgi:glycosyltransferase involved in cell wall biosynthesis